MHLHSVNQSSDIFKDYCCDACEGKNIQEIAEWYCETCLKCFCSQCNHHHGQLYSYHTTYGRGEINKWPLTKKIEDFLHKCDVHTDKKLKMLCQDHDQLCCTNCAFVNHRQYINVTIISDSIKNFSTDLKQLADKIQIIVTDLKKFESIQGAGIQSIEDSYNDRLQEIRDARERINAALNDIEKNTMRELDAIRMAHYSSLKKDVEKCNKLSDELKELSVAVQDLEGKDKAELAFIASKKGHSNIQESEYFLKETSVAVDRSFSFQTNTDIVQYLSKQVGLGNIAHPNHVLTVSQSNEFDLSILNDVPQTAQYISGICVIANNRIIVTDYLLKRVMLLDQNYKVINQLDMPHYVKDMCKISSNEVAVTLFEVDGSLVQFICVNNGQLVKGKQLKFQHKCAGIAHHEGKLFVTSRTALYQYSLSGELLKKYLEDTSSDKTVIKCAVSLTGDRIYVTNYTYHKLLTLATDGTLISSFTDPELQNPHGVHVTTEGQVLVCCGSSNSIIQVDSEGKKKLATLASKKDGMINPVSVCYNRNTNSLIVGQYNTKQNKNILVFKVK